MKKTLRVLAMAMSCVLLLGATVFSAGSGYTKEIIASYVGVNLVVEGVTVIPKDANGNIVEPFIYEGTTYLPVRAVGEALGMPVSWDGSTKTVYVGDVPGQDIYLLDVCPPYEKGGYGQPNELKMMGKKHQKGFTLEYYMNCYAIFNLNGEYDTLEFDFGHVDGRDSNAAHYDVYLDGEYFETIEGTGDMLVTHMQIPLNYALQLKIVASGYYMGARPVYGFANAILRK